MDRNSSLLRFNIAHLFPDHSLMRNASHLIVLRRVKMKKRVIERFVWQKSLHQQRKKAFEHFMKFMEKSRNLSFMVGLRGACSFIHSLICLTVSYALIHFSSVGEANAAVESTDNILFGMFLIFFFSLMTRKWIYPRIYPRWCWRGVGRRARRCRDEGCTVNCGKRELVHFFSHH